jgi:hypothetical protein
VVCTTTTATDPSPEVECAFVQAAHECVVAGGVDDCRLPATRVEALTLRESTRNGGVDAVVPWPPHARKRWDSNRLD